MVDAAVRTALAPFAHGPVELAYEGDVPGPGVWTTRGDGPRLEVTAALDRRERQQTVRVRDGRFCPLSLEFRGGSFQGWFSLGRAIIEIDEPDDALVAWARLLADTVALTKPKLGGTLRFDSLPPPGTPPRASNGPRMLVA